MPLEIISRQLLVSPLVCPIGRISLAGTIRNSPGIARDAMHLLGAYALVYLVDGSGRYRDANGVDRAVRPGDMLMLFPDIPHAYGPGQREHWSEIYIVFDGPAFDAWRATGLLNPAHPVWNMEPVDYWLRRFEDVLSDTRDPLGTICKLQQTLADCVRHGATRNAPREDVAWLERAIQQLHKVALADDPDWDLISRTLGLSYAGFRKRFTRLADKSPGSFLEDRRLDFATTLLQTPGLALKQIARQCGYCDEFHFSKRFKRRTGLSPREYRRRTGV